MSCYLLYTAHIARARFKVEIGFSRISTDWALNNDWNEYERQNNEWNEYYNKPAKRSWIPKYFQLKKRDIFVVICFLLACGGMDNMCTVYDLNGRDSSGAAKIVRELAGYEGFLSSCRFLDDTHIVTGSGDMKICVWDLEAGKKTSEMDGHNGDVVCWFMFYDLIL